MKRIFMMSCILAVCMAIGAATAAAEETLHISSISFLNGDNDPLYTTAETDVVVRTEIENNSGSAKGGLLIYAIYKESDKSLAAMTAKKIPAFETGGFESVSTALKLPDVTGYMVNVFLWDSMESGISYSPTYGIYDRLIAPPAPENPTAEHIDYTGMVLSWAAPVHHLDIVSYDIYCNGEKIGQTREPSYEVTGLHYGTEYTFAITANDAAGSSSEAAQIKAATTAVAYYTMGQPDEYQYFNRAIPNSPEFTGGFFNELLTAGPQDDQRMCRKIQFIKPYNEDPNGAANYLMFDINEDYITKEDNEVTVKITCLDEGNDTVGLEYNNPANAYQRVTFNKTNTGKWKTFTVHLSDAAFDNRQIGNTYDFRISTGESNTTEYIQKVEVFKGLVD